MAEAGNPPKKIEGQEPSSFWTLWKKLGWRKWLLILLFPIPMEQWWLTVIWAALFCALVWIFLAPHRKPSPSLAPPPERK
jgi:hypothetical protein